MRSYFDSARIASDHFSLILANFTHCTELNIMNSIGREASAQVFIPTVLAVYGRSDIGKTSTIREFSTALFAAYPHYKIIRGSTPAAVTGDISLIVDIGGRLVGIESMGDPNTNSRNRLLDLVASGCEVIVCATRTKGDTVEAVENLVSTAGFQTIWTANYQISDKASQPIANALKGGHILDLLKGLGVI